MNRLQELTKEKIEVAKEAGKIQVKEEEDVEQKNMKKFIEWDLK